MISIPFQEFLLSKKVLEKEIETAIENEQPLNLERNPEKIVELEKDLRNRRYIVIRSENMTFGMPNRIIVGGSIKYAHHTSNIKEDFMRFAKKRGNLPYLPGEIFYGSIPEAEDISLNQSARYRMD